MLVLCHKRLPRLAGIGIGHLPTCVVQKHIESGELVVIELENTLASQDLFMAWKITNKGKGLNKLKTILLDGNR